MCCISREVTIVVPTHNRSLFLRRLIYYFFVMDVKSRILVLDSSNDQEFALNAATIKRWGGSLDVDHERHYCGLIQKCRNGVDSVSTPYTVMCADDDFLLPDSVVACVKFLESNSDYSCASGVYVSVRQDKISHCEEMRCYTNNGVDAIARFRRMAEEWCCTFYHVYRTAVLQRSWLIAENSTDYERARVFTEVLLAQLSPTYGKLAILPQLHLLFELHQENAHRTVPLVLDSASGLTLYERFASALADELAGVSGESSAHCRQIVEEYHDLWWHGSTQLGVLGRFVQRWKRKLNNYRLFFYDWLSKDLTRVHIRRRLKRSDPRCQSPSWKTAQDIVTRFPTGMPESESA